MDFRLDLTRLNATIAIYDNAVLENAPQLVQNGPVAAENDHFDDRVLTEQRRSEHDGVVPGFGPKTD